MAQRIGLLGGMSATSSQLYFVELCRLTQVRFDGLTSPDLVVRSLELSPIEQWMR